MKRILAVALCLLFPLAVFSSEAGYGVKYDGGSIGTIKTGADLRLVIAGNEIRLMQKHEVVQVIPASAVTEISYGQDVHRRVGAAIGLALVSFGIGALMALTKSKKHFVGLTWAIGDTKGGFAMQCDKNDYRGVLTGLEGITGKKAVNSEAMTVKNWRVPLYAGEIENSVTEDAEFGDGAFHSRASSPFAPFCKGRVQKPAYSLGFCYAMEPCSRQTRDCSSQWSIVYKCPAAFSNKVSKRQFMFS